MAAISIEVTRTEQGELTLDIEVPAEDVRRGFQRTVRELARKRPVPGFRPGKAPRRLVEQHVGIETVREQALRRLTRTALSGALQERGIRPIASPDIEVSHFADGEPLQFSAHVVPTPTVELGEYKGLKVACPRCVVTEAQVDAVIERLRYEKCDWVEDAEAAIAEGDRVTVQAELRLPESEEELRLQSLHFVVGESHLEPALDPHVIGARRGDEVRFTAVYPDDFQSELLAGKSADFRVTIERVEHRVLPELTDDWIREQSHGQHDSVEALRQSIRDSLEQETLREWQFHSRRMVAVAAVEASEVTIPVSLVEMASQRRMQAFREEARRRQISIDDAAAQLGTDVEALPARFREESARILKQEWVLREIAQREGISAPTEEVDQLVALAATGSGRDVEAERRRLQRLDELWRIEDHVRTEAVISFLVEHAEVEMVMVDHSQEESEEETEAGETNSAEAPAADPGTETAGEAVETEASPESSD